MGVFGANEIKPTEKAENVIIVLYLVKNCFMYSKKTNFLVISVR
jgi:hypothetical protein